MTQVNIHEAKTHFSKLIARIQQGHEIIIAKAGRPVARLVPIVESTEDRTPGSAKGKIKISSDFNDPLPDEILAEFEQ
ncbi:MAG: type II toxin-antitoxin system Phd/YefM family antitoxin [Deltaproteobacteria bacterium]|nr:type II toxin-antitoxin system Phd/YefM family antitoxin [Deltaproteobacteria bacterium]